MLLNDRKVKILEAIINDYVRTAEPVGSRTIAKKYGFGISSATIRNEMSDLEDMGLIVQPHASAGRVPSDKGYRLYVDELMRRRELTIDEAEYLQRLVLTNVGRIDGLMRETARALAILTNYTTIVSEPKVSRTAVRHIQFVPLDESSIIMILVTENKAVKNHVVTLSQKLDYSALNNLSVIFNNLFSGCDLREILDSAALYTQEISAAGGIKPETLAPIWDAIYKEIVTEESVEVYTSGAKNILGFPEFSDLDKARAIFDALDEQDVLIRLLRGGGEDISIVIGEENSFDELKNCSIIKANYATGNQLFGSIGIIGPTRMDYSQVVSVLSSIVKNINTILNDLTGG